MFCEHPLGGGGLVVRASSVLDPADFGVDDEVTYRLEVLPERRGDVALEQRHGHPSTGAQLYRVGEAHGAVPGEG